ncbi:unnamed protein product, partial [marine sediment metagenome]
MVTINDIVFNKSGFYSTPMKKKEKSWEDEMSEEFEAI